MPNGEYLEWIPSAVAPHVKRLADAIGAHVEALVKAAVDRAIGALAAPPVQMAHDYLCTGCGAVVQVETVRCGDCVKTAPTPDLLTRALGSDIASMLNARSATDIKGAPFDEPPTDVRGEASARAASALETVPEPAVAAEQGSASSAGATSESRDREALQSRPALRVQAPAGGQGAPPRKMKTGPKDEPLTAIQRNPGRHAILDRAAFRGALADAREKREAAKRSRAERAASFIKRKPAKSPPQELAEETELAEAQKQPGEMPAPRSSFVVTPRAGHDLGAVEEVGSDHGDPRDAWG